MESLSNDDGDGYENVTYKVNSRCVRLYRAYFISFSSSNLGTFFWSWILKYCSKVHEKKKKVVVFVHVLLKTWNWVFSRRSRAVMIEKCFKKRDGRAELLFFHSKPISFFPILVDVAVVVAKASWQLTSESPETVPEEIAEHNSTPVPVSRIKWPSAQDLPMTEMRENTFRANLDKIITKPWKKDFIYQV